MDCVSEKSLIKEVVAMLSKFMRVVRFPFCFNAYTIGSTFPALHHQLPPPTMPKLQEILSTVLNRDQKKKSSIKVEWEEKKKGRNWDFPVYRNLMFSMPAGNRR